MRSFLFALGLLAPLPLLAQTPDLVQLAERLTRMTAVTGFERAALDSVRQLIPGARFDRARNVVVERGTGTATLVVCPFDEVGYVVGGIRDDGWLTLRRVGTRAPNSLFDQYHEGQRVMVFGRRGALPAVVAVRSTHLTRGRTLNEAPFNVDDAYVDVGASSAAEARTAGIEVLAPVAMLKQVTRYGTDLIAGPSVGRRSACAALVASAASASASASASGRIVIAFVVGQELGQPGLRTLAHLSGPFARTVIVDGGAGSIGTLEERSDTLLARALPGLGSVTRFSVPTRYTGTPVETVSLADVEALRNKLVAFVGGVR